jgi:hypothetical protein
VVECGGLENRYGPFRSIVGSNPTPSARSQSRCIRAVLAGDLHRGNRRRARRGPAEGPSPSADSPQAAGSRDRAPIATSSPAASNPGAPELDVVPMPAHPRLRPEGIVARHTRHCASRSGRSCDCRPGYQAQVYSPRDRRTIRKTFRTLADARAWAGPDSCVRSSQTQDPRSSARWRSPARRSGSRSSHGPNRGSPRRSSQRARSRPAEIASSMPGRSPASWAIRAGRERLARAWGESRAWRGRSQEAFACWRRPGE